MDLRYLNNEKKFLDDSFDVFGKYFLNRNSFDIFYNSIVGDLNKNKFLKIAAFYKFLVINGKYSLDNKNYIDYIDHTYKYIAIFSFIEDLYSDENDYIEFYEWLQKKDKNFPIINSKELEKLHDEYLSIYGCTQKSVKFFNLLDEKTKNFIINNFNYKDSPKNSIESLAKYLYQIRSDFVHKSGLVNSFNDGLTIFSKNNKMFLNNLNFNNIKEIFEHGFLIFFGYIFN